MKSLPEDVLRGLRGSFADIWRSRLLQSAWGPIMALGLAAVLRGLGICTRPIWYDEAFAILFSSKGPAAMVVGTLAPTGAGAADIHPLGYYTLLWLWMRAFGEALPSVRTLSILAGLVTVGVGYALTRSMKDRRTALVAALLLAAAPFQVHYSQEIRMYAFLGLWLCLATYFYWRGANSDGWGWWLGFSFCAALAQYTHNLAAAYLVALAAWPLLRRQWVIALRLSLAGSLALLLYLPWLINVPAQLAKVSHAYWIERPPAYRLLMLPPAYLANLPVPGPLLGAALFASLAVLALGLRQAAQRQAGNRAGNWASGWMLYMSFAPPLMLFGISQLVPVYLERALIASGVTFCIWVACQLTEEATKPPVRWIMVGLILLTFAAGLFQHLTYRGFPYAPYESIASDFRRRIEPGDTIIHSSKLSFLPTLYYDQSLPAAFIADPPGSSTDTLAEGTQRVLGIDASDNMEQAAAGAQRVWFALYDQSDAEYRAAGYARHPHLEWLLEHYQQAEDLQMDDLRIYLFTKP